MTLNEELLYELHYRRKMPKTFIWKFLYGISDCFRCCCYLPCPPCPACVIPKLAFQAPKPTYTFVETKMVTFNAPVYEIAWNQHFPEKVAKSNISKMVPDEQVTNINAYLIRPLHTEQLACYYMKWVSKKRNTTSRYVILRCHRNDSDIGMQLPVNAYTAWRLCSDVFEFDYSGYGISTSSASESNLFKDVMAAYKFLTEELKVNPNKIIVFGQSLGSVPAIYLASRGVPIKGLIVEGVLMSAFRIYCPDKRKSMTCDQFDSVESVPLIKCPTLVIHGGLDDTTYYEHAEHFIDLCQTLVPPLVIPDGKHNDLLTYRSYWNRLEIFLAKELGEYDMPYNQQCGVGCSVVHTKAVAVGEGYTKHLKLKYPYKKH